MPTAKASNDSKRPEKRRRQRSVSNERGGRFRVWLQAIGGILPFSRKRERHRVNRREVERLVGMPINDLGLFEQAMRHRSLLRGHTKSHMVSNERLEFLGDAVLGAVVAHKLYQEFAEEDEGFLTRVRSRLVNGQTLAGYARRVGLGPLILMSDNMAGADGRDNATILADAFEAVIGAVYLDQGYDASRKFVLRILQDYVDLELASQEQTNFKSMLLELVQARGWAQPAYEVVAEEGPSHDRTFTIEVHVEGSPIGSGRAQSKKKAEQEAAKEALGVLEKREIDLGKHL